MSITNLMNDSFSEKKTTPLVILLQIPKSVVIDKSTTIDDLKKLSKQMFSKYLDDFSFYIKDFNISSLDSVNAIRTFDYYKSNTLTLIEKNIGKEKSSLNESYILSMGINSEEDKICNPAKSRGISFLNKKKRKIY